MCFLRELRRCGLARADRPHRLVGDDQCVARIERRELSAEYLLGGAALAFGFGFADAGDHAEPGLECRGDATPGSLVSLCEELPTLGMSNDRAAHAELVQHCD